jgi:hypothetical protein
VLSFLGWTRAVWCEPITVHAFDVCFDTCTDRVRLLVDNETTRNRQPRPCLSRVPRCSQMERREQEKLAPSQDQKAIRTEGGGDASGSPAAEGSEPRAAPFASPAEEARPAPEAPAQQQQQAPQDTNVCCLLLRGFIPELTRSSLERSDNANDIYLICGGRGCLMVSFLLISQRKLIPMPVCESLRRRQVRALGALTTLTSSRNRSKC